MTSTGLIRENIPHKSMYGECKIYIIKFAVMLMDWISGFTKLPRLRSITVTENHGVNMHQGKKGESIATRTSSIGPNMNMSNGPKVRKLPTKCQLTLLSISEKGWVIMWGCQTMLFVWYNSQKKKKKTNIFAQKQFCFQKSQVYHQIQNVQFATYKGVVSS